MADVLAVIRLMKQQQGERTQKEFASEIGISEQYLSDIYKGRREPGPTVCEALGVVSETTYRIPK